MLQGFVAAAAGWTAAVYGLSGVLSEPVLARMSEQACPKLPACWFEELQAGMVAPAASLPYPIFRKP